MLPFGWPSVEVAPLEWITHRDLGETNVAVEDSQDDNSKHTHIIMYIFKYTDTQTAYFLRIINCTHLLNII